MTRFRLIFPSLFLRLCLVSLLLGPLFVAYLSERIEPKSETGGYMLAVITPIILIFGYGGYRALRFHPTTNPSYRDWLATMPWSYGKPLPLGPLHLVWEDLIVVMCFLAVSVIGYTQVSDELIDKSAFLPKSLYMLVGTTFLSFFSGYVLCLFLNLKHDQIEVFAVVCLAPLIVYPHFNIWVATIVLLVIYLIVNAAVRRSLSDFPFNLPAWTKDNRIWLLEASRAQGIIRWPLSHIGPRLNKESKISFSVALGISAIVAWWVLALTHGGIIFSELATGFTLQELAEAIGNRPQGSPEYEDVFWVLWIVLCVILTVARTLIYLTGTWPPISFAGRIGSGRLVVPGYDQVFIAPLAMLAYGVAVPCVLLWAGVSLIVVPAVSVFGLVLIALATGPSLAKWQMTGRFRIRPWSPPPVENKNRSNEAKGSFTLAGSDR